MSELERKEVNNEELNAVNGGAVNGVILCRLPRVGQGNEEGQEEVFAPESFCIRG